MSNSPIHNWIKRLKGTADHCEKCGRTENPLKKGRYFEWSNKDHKYRRDLNDWWQLCIKCHRVYDQTLISPERLKKRLESYKRRIKELKVKERHVKKILKKYE